MTSNYTRRRDLCFLNEINLYVACCYYDMPGQFAPWRAILPNQCSAVGQHLFSLCQKWPLISFIAGLRSSARVCDHQSCCSGVQRLAQNPSTGRTLWGILPWSTRQISCSKFLAKFFNPIHMCVIILKGSFWMLACCRLEHFISLWWEIFVVVLFQLTYGHRDHIC